MGAKLHNQPVVVCHDCDAVVKKKPVSVGQKLVCPRCHHVLVAPRHDVIRRGLALSLTSLALAAPAFTLPIMHFSMLGIKSHDTLVRNVLALFEQGYFGMGLLVLFCSMIAPVMESLLVGLACLLVMVNRIGPLLVRALKAHSRLRRWAMLEVYMLGIVVAYIKMLSEGEMRFGIGLYCFVAMFFITTMNTLLFDTKVVWEMVGRRLEQNQQPLNASS